MSRPTLADNMHCTGCMACVDSCAQKALSCIVDSEGFYTYKVDESRCVLCHKCEKICPIVNNYKYGTNELTLSKPYAAWTTNEKLRESATSGGVFPAVASWVLKQGGVVYGARQEKFYVHHEQIEKVEDIECLQGSKYTQSKTEGIHSSVKESLDEGKKVLFTGLGCQVAGLLSFLKGNKNLDNMFTMDLICGGVPSLFLIQNFIEHYSDSIESIESYRSKERYEFRVKEKGGKTKTMSKEERPLPLYGFTTGAAKRYICYDCPFAKGHRCSDITIGDYWGNTHYPEQKKQGVSVVIAHSDKGKRMLEASELESHEILWRDFLLNNTRMVYGHAPIPKVRRELGAVFMQSSYNRLLEVFANKASSRRPWTMINRIVRIIEGKLLAKKRMNIADQILKNNGQ